MASPRSQQHQAASKAGKPLVNFRAKLAALIVVDESGSRVFSDEDAAALGQKNAKALDRIFADLAATHEEAALFDMGVDSDFDGLA